MKKRIAAAALFVFATGAQAQNTPADPTVVSEMTVWTVTLHPKAIETPLLKRTLLPRPEAYEAGNAASHYDKALILHLQGNSSQDERAGELLTLPLNQLTDEEMERVRLPEKELHELEVGAYRASVDWDHNLQQDGFNTLIPSVGGLRRLSRGVGLEARIAVKAHRYDDAVRWLQVDYALARNIGAGDTLIEALVGVAIQGVADTQLRTLMEQPDAPNLFWAVATMPRLVDPARAFGKERAFVYYTFPELKEARQGTFHPGQWDNFLAHFGALSQAREGDNVKPDVEFQAGRLALGISIYGPAKAYLRAHGFTPAQVEAMPVEEVLMRGISAGFEGPADDSYVWTEIPYWQRTKHALAPAEDVSTNPLTLFANVLSPSLERARLNLEMAERYRAVLAGMEALRDYAAGHKGTLPEKLDDISGLPIPWDPIWNRPFEYKKEGNHATLTGAPAAPDDIRSGLRVDITLEK